MAIEYKVIQKFNLNDKKKGKYYASTNTTGETPLQVLCEEVEQISTVNGADLQASLYVLGETMPRHLANGSKVRLDGLGSFYIAISSDGKDTAEEVTSHSMKNARIIFKPSAKLSRMLKSLKYKIIPST